MKTGRADLAIHKEFPTMTCENEKCGLSFMLFAVRFVEPDIGDVRIMPQVSKNLFCPYCGKKGKP
jgi:hypothetical protein